MLRIDRSMRDVRAMRFYSLNDRRDRAAPVESLIEVYPQSYYLAHSLAEIRAKGGATMNRALRSVTEAKFKFIGTCRC